jgi:hypothetical protein
MVFATFLLVVPGFPVWNIFCVAYFWEDDGFVLVCAGRSS